MIIVEAAVTLLTLRKAPQKPNQSLFHFQRQQIRMVESTLATKVSPFATVKLFARKLLVESKLHKHQTKQILSLLQIVFLTTVKKEINDAFLSQFLRHHLYLLTTRFKTWLNEANQATLDLLISTMNWIHVQLKTWLFKTIVAIVIMVVEQDYGSTMLEKLSLINVHLSTTQH